MCSRRACPGWWSSVVCVSAANVSGRSGGAPEHLFVRATSLLHSHFCDTETLQEAIIRSAWLLGGGRGSSCVLILSSRRAWRCFLWIVCFSVFILSVFFSLTCIDHTLLFSLQSFWASSVTFCVCVLCRNAGSAVYGTRSVAQETFFQQQGGSQRNSGIPNQQDSAFCLPSKARLRLMKHGVNLLWCSLSSEEFFYKLSSQSAYKQTLSDSSTCHLFLLRFTCFHKMVLCNFFFFFAPLYLFYYYLSPKSGKQCLCQRLFMCIVSVSKISHEPTNWFSWNTQKNQNGCHSKWQRKPQNG